MVRGGDAGFATGAAAAEAIDPSVEGESTAASGVITGLTISVTLSETKDNRYLRNIDHNPSGRACTLGKGILVRPPRLENALQCENDT
jgi:hypothetical protein